MTTLQLIQYYVNLLIIQYLNLSRASATIAADVAPAIMPLVTQEGLIFTPNPTSGTFVLAYKGVNSGTINWNDNSAAIQAAIRQIPALKNITVSGSISTSVIITFSGGVGFPVLFTVFSNSLVNGVTPTVISIGYVTPFSLAFSSVPTSGDYSFDFNGNTSGITIPYNANAATVQANLIANFPQLNGISVVGNTTDGFIIYGTTNLLTTGTNTLLNGANAVSLTLSAVDETLPIAVQNCFALDYAVGKQLDILGKYIGVTRSANTRIGYVTLNDTDYLTFLKFAIVQNNSGSSMADIEFNMNLIFPGQFLIFDYKSMYMSYVLSSTLGSSSFFAILVQENLLPRPMAVGVSVIVTPIVANFFGFNSQFRPHVNNKPFNRYSAFDTTWRFLSYANGFFA